MYNRELPHQIIGIGNAFEFHNRLFPPRGAISASKELKNGFAASAEMACFWGGVKTFVLTPEKVDALFLEDLAEILNLQIQSVQPQSSTGLISTDFTPYELEQIVGRNGDRGIVLLPYGVSHRFYKLLEKFESIGVTPAVRTYPLPESYWTIDFIDSKLGGRNVLASVGEELGFLSVPFGILANSQNQANEIVHSLIRRQKTFVLKANHGHGGRQVFSFDINKLDKQNELIENLKHAFLTDPYMDMPPFLVEEYVHNEDCYLVNGNGQITQSDEIIYEGPSKLIATDTKLYVGSQIGTGLFHHDLLLMLKAVTLSVGKRLAELGYTGWYDIDMIFDPNRKHLYGLEINPRATGITYVMGIAKLIFGENWQESRSLISVDRFLLRRPIENYSKLRPLIARINRDCRSATAGVVPIATGAMAAELPYIGFVVFGSDINMAQSIRSEFEECLLKEQF